MGETAPARLTQRHCGVGLGGHDVYLNVAGGMRIQEPAGDLAAAAALVSSLANAPLPADAVYFGEVSLSGAIRPVAQSASRLKEAAKLGFGRAVVPEAARAETVEPDLIVTDVANLANLVADISARGKAGMPRLVDKTGDIGHSATVPRRNIN